MKILMSIFLQDMNRAYLAEISTAYNPQFRVRHDCNWEVGTTILHLIRTVCTVYKYNWVNTKIVYTTDMENSRLDYILLQCIRGRG